MNSENTLLPFLLSSKLSNHILWLSWMDDHFTEQFFQFPRPATNAGLKTGVNVEVVLYFTNKYR